MSKLAYPRCIEDIPSYWQTPIGILQRTELAAETFIFRMYNGAVQAIGNKNNVWGFEISGYIDSVTCTTCDGLIGQQFRLGQFMPDLPRHPHCRCSYRIVGAHH